MREAFALTERMVIALLAGLVMLGFGVIGVAAQQATPVSGIAASLEPTASSDTPMQTAQRESPSVEAQQADGTVNVTIQDGNLDPVPGACLLMEGQAGESSYRCDGREDGVADGILRFTLPPGDYNLVVARAPIGYISGTNVFLSLGAGLTVQVTIDLQPGGRAVFVATVDENDQPVSEACYSIFTDVEFGKVSELVSSNCAPAPGDPDDSSVSFPGIAPGSYLAVQTQAPIGHVLADETPFVVPADGTGPIIVTVVSSAFILSGDLIVNKVDDHGASLAGACFAVHLDAGGGQRGDLMTRQCDAEDGQLVFTGLALGAYVLVEDRAPDGYLIGGQRQVTISAGVATTVTVPNTPGGSDLTIRTIDPETGAPLTGACFAVHHDDDGGVVSPASLLERRCDDADGSDNGVTSFAGVAAGDYIVVEEEAPAGYKVTSETVPFSVDGITDVTLTVENVPLTLADQLVVVLKRILREILG
ncbi:MAG: SpaA isopeptide-forming pilin-related protein [Chloroflexota bacterium]|nr:SpaA isopeptide-forming pilin-related protein [Chloroflexota bacterium]